MTLYNLSIIKCQALFCRRKKNPTALSFGKGDWFRPHDLRRHAVTYASRSGAPLEIVSKVILRHASLSTTQVYLGKVSDIEAIRWIENIYG
jgi:integrase